jgi:hypothetical protein
MSARDDAFLALNESIMLLAAAKSSSVAGEEPEVAVDLPLVVRADAVAGALIVRHRDTGRELYRISHPQ